MEQMTTLYLLSTAFTAFVLAFVFENNEILNSKAANICFGVALCPFAQFLWCLIAAITIGNLFLLSRYFYILGLPAVMGILLGFEIKKRKKNKKLRVRTDTNRKKLILIGILLSVFVYGVWGWGKIAEPVRTSSSFLKYDNLEYFRKAAYFAEHRTADSISFIYGLPDGSALPDSHFPSWTLYLGYAFMHTNAKCIEYPVHEAALYAVSILPMYLIAAAMALFLVLNNGKYILLLPIVLGANFVLIDQVTSSNRIWFSTVAVLIFITIWIDCLQEEKPKKCCLLAFLGSFLLTASHLINVVVLVGSILSLLIVVLLERVFYKNNNGNCFAMIIAATVGGASGFLGNIISKITINRWYPVKVYFSDYSFSDYPSSSQSSQNIINITDSMRKTLYLDDNINGILIIIVALALICAVALSLVRRQYSYIWRQTPKAEVYLSLLCIFLFLPQTGLLDSRFFYRFSQGFSKVPRYNLNYHLIGIIFVYSIFVKSLLYFVKLMKKRKAHVSIGVLITAICFSCWFSYIFVLFNNNIHYITKLMSNERLYLPGDQLFEKRYSDMVNKCSVVDTDRKIMTTGNLGYVLGDRTLVYNHIAAKQIYDSDVDKIPETLSYMHVDAVVLPKGHEGNTNITVLPWYDYVTNCFDAYELDTFSVFLRGAINNTVD